MIQNIIQKINYYSVFICKQTPSNFSMKQDISLSEFALAELYDKFKNLYKKFVQKRNHVIIDEIGAADKNNTQGRIAFGKYYLFSSFIWDNDNLNNSTISDDIFRHLQRDGLVSTSSNFISPLMKAGQNPLHKEEKNVSVSV